MSNRNTIKCGIIAVAALVTLSSHLCAAEKLKDSLIVAEQLGTVIGAEAFCDMRYDIGAVSDYVMENVGKRDMAFTTNLGSFVEKAKFLQEQMGRSEKVAYCTQMHRLAYWNKFVK